MSNSQEKTIFQRRTSERRRLKMLKNINEFKIMNPYKYSKQDYTFPEELSKQLKKIDFLSATSISLIQFDKDQYKRSDSEQILYKMNEALRGQEDRYNTIFGANMEIPINPEDNVYLQESQNSLKKSLRFGDEIVQTKQQISINAYQADLLQRNDQEQCPFAINRMFPQEELGLFDNKSIHENSKSYHCRQQCNNGADLMEDEYEYEHYFAN